MKPLSIQDVRRAVAGRGLLPPADAPMVKAVCTDTRSITPSSLFVAIRGETFDGHRFLNEAAAGGAVAAFVEELPAEMPRGMHLILVPDTRKAMGRLAKHVRQQLRAKVVAVAGSNGKTGTKLLIEAVLSVKLRGSCSPKSFNNDIGVPLTIFPADAAHDYVIVEIGTNHPGEISALAKIAMPDIAVLTNCGPEHLEFLGDLRGVRKENASLIEGMNEKSLLIVNGDDPELLAALGEFRGKRLTFGFGDQNDLVAADVSCAADGVRFKLNHRLPVFVPLLGRHTAANALAAIAVGRRFNLSEAEIIAGLAKATGPAMRLQVQALPNGVTLLNDAYNANPASMRAALETLRDFPATGRRVAVLGDMRELGPTAEQLHAEVGELAAACKLDALVCVGPLAVTIATAAQRAGVAAVEMFTDTTAAAPAVRDLLRPGDVVLLKGSRAMRLEQIFASLP